MPTPTIQISQQARQELLQSLLATSSPFIHALPKIELHVHLEGTLTASTRFKIAQRNNSHVVFGLDHRQQQHDTLDSLERAYADVISSAQLPDYPDREKAPATFFEAYYSGFGSFRTRQDFYDVAMEYFRYAASVNVRYCEVFFDAQGHTRRGVEWSEMMGGLRQAQEEAAAKLNVKCQWIMCFLRDSTPESAMQHYEAALEYKDMIVGFGLDSNEYRRPPWLFDEVFALARRDGFRITAHCDVGVENTHQHIRHVATGLGRTGSSRIDHGLNVADKTELVALVKERSISLTICPWAYLRRESYESIAERIRLLLDAGVTVCVSSDSPAYMDGAFLLPNILLVQKMCGLSDEDVLRIMRNSVDMSWADDEIKTALFAELQGIGSGGR